MRNMKDSGIEWIGEIPNDWTVTKLKYIGTYINGYAFKPDDWGITGLPIIRIQDLTGSNDDPNYYDGEIDNKYIVQRGNILVSWAATLDAFIWNKEDGLLNQHIFKVLPDDNVVDYDYFFWLVKEAMQNMNNDNKHGIFMQHVTLGVFGNYSIPIPPIAKQKIIAAYLHTKCSEIDVIISKQEAIINALKKYRISIISEAVTKGINPIAEKKESGYYWMPEVPSLWTESTVYNCIRFEGGSQPPLSYFIDHPQEGYVRLIQNRDYKTDDYATYVPANMVSKFCVETDIMIGRYGPPVFVLHRGLKGAYNVAIMKATPLMLDKEFCWFYLQNESLLSYVDSFSARTAGQSGVNPEILKKYPIFIPPIDEQIQIANYLKRKTERIDIQIEKRQKLIDLYNEYKKSLIYEVVTGKREIW